MKKELVRVKENISPYIHRTPILTSKLADEMAASRCYFKCENFQKMGAFKMRGATNAILELDSKSRNNGVVTHSSGNFAQALALAAKLLNTKATIIMPSNAPNVKIEAVKNYGANIILCEPTNEAREKTTDQFIQMNGGTFIHPSNDLNVILGNGTAAMEIFEDYSDLDFLIVPVGGGGIIAGSALAAKYFGKNCKVYGAEPKNVDDAKRSFDSGIIHKNKSLNTIADGLKTHLGDINFPIIKENVEDILLVEENEIVEAMKFLWERLKIIIEPSCAVAYAALLKNKTIFKGKKVGIILTGGNVDLTKLPF